MLTLTSSIAHSRSSTSTLAEPRNTATIVASRTALSGALIQSSRSSTEGIARIAALGEDRVNGHQSKLVWAGGYEGTLILPLGENAAAET